MKHWLPKSPYLLRYLFDRKRTLNSGLLYPHEEGYTFCPQPWSTRPTVATARSSIVHKSTIRHVSPDIRPVHMHRDPTWTTSWFHTPPPAALPSTPARTRTSSACLDPTSLPEPRLAVTPSGRLVGWAQNLAPRLARLPYSSSSSPGSSLESTGQPSACAKFLRLPLR